jgi:hypothetical protein
MVIIAWGHPYVNPQFYLFSKYFSALFPPEAFHPQPSRADLYCALLRCPFEYDLQGAFLLPFLKKCLA